MPGVGKTALAVHAAQRLKDQFAGQPLFIDLHGHTPGQDPLASEAALANLLTAVGVESRNLPQDLAGRAGLWRETMAGRRALLILDNAASSAQVTPLLPGGDSCLVLVTSRRYLGDLPGPVTALPVDVLAPGQGREMFARLVPRAAAAADAAVEEVVRLAGGLPLAIRLLARVYARHPSWTLADLVAETRAAVLTMAAESDSVAAAFDLSYRYLAPARQRFFRRLGLHPGTTTDAYAAAALTGVPLAVATALLDALHGEGLLTEVSYRRYAMHDLIRRYARDLAAAGDPETDRSQAVGRLLDYYQQTAATTRALLFRRSFAIPAVSTGTVAPAAGPSLRDRDQALAWARAERGNLLACLDHVTRAGQHARVVALTDGLAGLLRQDGPRADAITRHEAAVRTAHGLGDRVGEAGALVDLGVARRQTGDYPGAAGAAEEALGIYRDLGDRLGQAGALVDLGSVRRMAGDYPGAAGLAEEALGIYRDLGDRQGQAEAIGDLGAVRWVTGDYPGAAGALDEALGLYRNLGDRLGQGNTLVHLGAVRRLTGDYAGAIKTTEEAHGIYCDLSNRLGQGNALSQLGGVLRLAGDYPGATRALEEALVIYRDLSERGGQASALGELGAVRRLTGDYPGAGRALEGALGIFRDIGDGGGEAEALNEIGTLSLARGDLDQAVECHRQALRLARQIGSPQDEASALAALGRCAVAAGDAVSAQASLQQAHEIFRRIGAAEASGITAELSAITPPGGGGGLGRSPRL
jgi:tetratricopeptide (TPR) repeat protein